MPGPSAGRPGLKPWMGPRTEGRGGAHNQEAVRVAGREQKEPHRGNPKQRSVRPETWRLKQDQSLAPVHQSHPGDSDRSSVVGDSPELPIGWFYVSNGLG